MEQLEDVEAPPHAAAADDRTASRDKQHHLKPTAETARAAEHIRLSFALLEHLSLTLARKGTPFELFGVQVNGGHFRALLSVLSAAVATALVRYIAVSQ